MIKRMGFRELIQSDVKNVFLNPVEFGELHVINGLELICMIDDNEMIEREKRQMNQSYRDGLHIKQMMIYVAAADFGPLPLPGRRLSLDGKNYLVTDAINECGIYSISLEAVKS